MKGIVIRDAALLKESRRVVDRDLDVLQIEVELLPLDGIPTTPELRELSLACRYTISLLKKEVPFLYTELKEKDQEAFLQFLYNSLSLFYPVVFSLISFYKEYPKGKLAYREKEEEGILTREKELIGPEEEEAAAEAFINWDPARIKESNCLPYMCCFPLMRYLAKQEIKPEEIRIKSL